MRKQIEFALMLAIFASVAARAAQAPPCSSRKIAVNIVNNDGDVYMDCSVDCFQASVRGQTIKIISATRAGRPPRIVVVLDTGQGMFDESTFRGRWPLALKLARDFFERAPEKSEIALLIVTDKVEERFGFGHRAEALARLRELQAGPKRLSGYRKTAFYESAVAAVNELGVPQPGDVVYAITNGLEMDTHTSASRVEQAFLASGVRLFVAHLPMDMQALGARMNLNASVEQVRNLALDTGGIILPAITTAADPMRRDILDTMDWAKFDKWLTNFYEDMREYYLMELEFPPQAEGQKWKLELVQTADKRLAGRELVYPNKIPSCRPLH